MDDTSQKLACSAARSRVMRMVKSKNTKPELVVRKLLFAMGFRYRLHPRSLPGKPDIVLKRHQSLIFIHGCFWHGHSCPRGARMPKSNAQYWATKIERNRERDRNHLTVLNELGWKVLVVWECELKNQITLENKLRSFLEI